MGGPDMQGGFHSGRIFKRAYIESKLRWIKRCTAVPRFDHMIGFEVDRISPAGLTILLESESAPVRHLSHLQSPIRNVLFGLRLLHDLVKGDDGVAELV